MPSRASESAVVADIIAGVNRIIAREDSDENDFDNDPELPTNRGNKLKRKAKYAHEGRIWGTGRTIRKKINHAGYDRYIIARKPKRYDEEGYLLDDDDQDEEADADAAERDPYHGVDVRELLMPLTSASELWRHPGMAHAFKSGALTDMTQKAQEMVRKEKRTLHIVKQLATKLRGDSSRVSCSMVHSHGHDSLFDTDAVFKSILESCPAYRALDNKAPQATIEVNVIAAEEVTMNGSRGNGIEAEDISLAETAAALPAIVNGVGEAVSSVADSHLHATLEANEQQPNGIVEEKLQGDATTDVDHGSIGERVDAGLDRAEVPAMEPEPNSDGTQENEPILRRLTRGAAAAANGSMHEGVAGRRSPSPPVSLPSVHPAFIPPKTSVPDRDLGLPPSEAEDMRKVTNVFVQKQEEVVRGAEKLYEQLLRAERLRKTIYRWSRAEEHVGEMSDGEEWVDLEEWGLEAPLRKGAAEGDEEANHEDRKGKGRRTRAVG